MSQTAITYKKLLSNTYKLSNYYHFTLLERGKRREIDAPKIQDRQIHKVYTQKALIPLYTPHMIYNNGASLKNKGLTFAINQLKQSLHNHYRKYGRNGYIILIDYKQFFPTTPHNTIYKKHNELFYDKRIKDFGDNIVKTINKDCGLPIGVEPSQIEMVALPSMVDTYMTCQLGLQNYGHYMDDFYILIPPTANPNLILNKFITLSEQNGFNINKLKTRILPFSHSFRFCKIKFMITKNGKILMRYTNKILYRANRKLKHLYNKLVLKEINYYDLWSSINGIKSCLKQYACHNQLLKFYRMFYNIYKFSCIYYEDFERKDILNGIYMSYKI